MQVDVVATYIGPHFELSWSRMPMQMLPMGLIPAAIVRTGPDACSATPLTEAPCSTDGVSPVVWMRVMRLMHTARFKI